MLRATPGGVADPGDGGILSRIPQRHSHAMPTSKPSTHWMETHFMSWAPRAKMLPCESLTASKGG